MKYSDQMWGPVMLLLQRMLDHPLMQNDVKALIRGKFQYIYDRAVERGYISQADVRDAFRYIMNQRRFVPGTVQGDLTPAEKLFPETGIPIVSTKAGEKALREAEGLLAKRASELPLREAEAELQQAQGELEQRRKELETEETRRRNPAEAVKAAEEKVRIAKKKLKETEKAPATVAG